MKTKRSRADSKLHGLHRKADDQRPALTIHVEDSKFVAPGSKARLAADLFDFAKKEG